MENPVFKRNLVRAVEPMARWRRRDQNENEKLNWRDEVNKPRWPPVSLCWCLCSCVCPAAAAGRVADNNLLPLLQYNPSPPSLLPPAASAAAYEDRRGKQGCGNLCRRLNMVVMFARVHFNNARADAYPPGAVDTASAAHTQTRTRRRAVRNAAPLHKARLG